MAKRLTYDERLKKYQQMCVNHARLELLTVKFLIASEKADAAGASAVKVAKWGFEAKPELREA